MNILIKALSLWLIYSVYAMRRTRQTAAENPISSEDQDDADDNFLMKALLAHCNCKIVPSSQIYFCGVTKSKPGFGNMLVENEDGTQSDFLPYALSQAYQSGDYKLVHAVLTHQRVNREYCDGYNAYKKVLEHVRKAGLTEDWLRQDPEIFYSIFRFHKKPHLYTLVLQLAISQDMENIMMDVLDDVKHDKSRRSLQPLIFTIQACTKLKKYHFFLPLIQDQTKKLDSTGRISTVIKYTSVEGMKYIFAADPSYNTPEIRLLCFHNAIMDGAYGKVKWFLKEGECEPASHDNKALKLAAQYSRHRIFMLLLSYPEVMKSIDMKSLCETCVATNKSRLVDYLIRKFGLQSHVPSLIDSCSSNFAEFGTFQTLLDFLPDSVNLYDQFYSKLDSFAATDGGLFPSFLEDPRFDASKIQENDILEWDTEPWIIGVYLSNPKVKPSMNFLEKVGESMKIAFNFSKNSDIFVLVKSGNLGALQVSNLDLETTEWAYLLNIAVLNGDLGFSGYLLQKCEEHNFDRPYIINYAISSRCPECALMLMQSPKIMKTLFLDTSDCKHVLKRLVRFSLQTRTFAILDHIWNGIVSGYSPIQAELVRKIEEEFDNLNNIADPIEFSCQLSELTSTNFPLYDDESSDHEVFFATIVEAHFAHRTFMALHKQAGIYLFPEMEKLTWYFSLIQTCEDELI